MDDRQWEGRTCVVLAWMCMQWTRSGGPKRRTMQAACDWMHPERQVSSTNNCWRPAVFNLAYRQNSMAPHYLPTCGSRTTSAGPAHHTKTTLCGKRQLCIRARELIPTCWCTALCHNGYRTRKHDYALVPEEALVVFNPHHLHPGCETSSAMQWFGLPLVI